MTSADPWSIPISALQHHLYCPRQCGLIHLEQVWTENVETALGRQMHQRADMPTVEMRRGARVVTAVPLNHPGLGIHGVADVVEFSGRGPSAIALPVEYKRGRPKSHRADEVQLCAQALCLEHMLHQHLTSGALYYGSQKRRHEVTFDDALRALTLQVIAAVRSMLVAGLTPLAHYEPARCDNCSLQSDCRPRCLEAHDSVQQWLRLQLKE